MTKLAVIIHGERAGTISDGMDGRAVFSYSDDYLARTSPVPLSTSFPLDSRLHEAEAWLDGLLADNDEVRRRWAIDYGIYSTRPSDLLKTPVGRDCAGAVQFCRPEDTAAVLSRGSTLESLTESDVAGIVARLRTDAAAWNANRRETAFSLGGAQTKTALRFDDGRWSLPGGSACTTHILKPAPERFPDLDIVEHLCQQTARNLGIQAAATQCAYFDDEQTLVVARYDRVFLPDNDWHRIHQEDMCQALGVPPLRKYQTDGGPTPADIAALLRTHSSDPESDVRRFLDGLIYNWLIVNTDGHAKNYSLLIAADQVRLAPLYDLCSILPYSYNESERIYLPKQKMAMKVGKEYTLQKTDKESAWDKTADELNIPRSETSERMLYLSERIGEALNSAIATLPAKAAKSLLISALSEGIEKRAATGIAVARDLASSSPRAPKRPRR